MRAMSQCKKHEPAIEILASDFCLDVVPELSACGKVFPREWHRSGAVHGPLELFSLILAIMKQLGPRRAGG